MKYLTRVVFILFFFNKPLFAQTETKSDSDSIDLLNDRLDSLDESVLQKPYIQIGGSYASKVVYNGRTEGVSQYGILPAATWHIAKGWMLNYGGTVWSAAKPSYTYTSIGAAKSLKSGDFDATIGYNRLFFNDGVALQKADFKYELEASASYSAGDFNFDAYFLRLGGKSTGNFVSPSVSWEKSDRFGDKHQYKWHIGPKVAAEFGDDAVSQIIQKVRRKVVTTTTTKKQVFELLNYQLNAVAGLKTTNSEIEVSYIYNLPKNATLPNTNTAFGYLEIEVKQRFGW